MAEDVRKAIAQANLRLREGLRRGGAAAVSYLYADDAFLCPPNSPMLSGQANIKAFWDGAINMGLKDGVLTTLQLVGTGDITTELGKYVLKIQQKDQLVESKGKYVILWKLHCDIWNSDT